MKDEEQKEKMHKLSPLAFIFLVLAAFAIGLVGTLLASHAIAKTRSAPTYDHYDRTQPNFPTHVPMRETLETTEC